MRAPRTAPFALPFLSQPRLVAEFEMPIVRSFVLQPGRPLIADDNP